MDKILKKKSSIKIFDCFMYYNEDLLLNFRLNYLSKYVDKFVIVESGHYHNGKKKKFNFNLKKFIKFKDKIIYIKLKTKPKNLHKINRDDNPEITENKHILNGYIWDKFQRNSISKGLKSANQNDIVIVSDLDEIPNLEKLDFTKVKNKLIFFKQKILFYKFNLIYKKKSWWGSKACKKKDLISPQWLRDIKHTKYQPWRIDIFFSNTKYIDIFHVNCGGWHFTNLKTASELLKKLKNYAHYFEFSQSGLKLNDIKKMIINRKAIYNHELDQKYNKFDGKIKLHKYKKKSWPSYLKLNLSKYKKWIA